MAGAQKDIPEMAELLGVGLPMNKVYSLSDLRDKLSVLNTALTFASDNTTQKYKRAKEMLEKYSKIMADIDNINKQRQATKKQNQIQKQATKTQEPAAKPTATQPKSQVKEPKGNRKYFKNLDKEQYEQVVYETDIDRMRLYNISSLSSRDNIWAQDFSDEY